MGRFISVILLVLLIYNMVGYSVVYLLEERHSISDSGMNTIEMSPGDREILIKIPVSVPYQTSRDKPEAAEGQIEHDGKFYKLLTQQLINDTLYVHARFDQNARDQFMNLVSKINDEVTGNSADPQKQAPSTVLKSFLKEYMASGKKHVFYVLEWILPYENPSSFQAILVSICLSVPSPPPNLV